MRRVVVPRVRTTKPVTSASGAAAAAVATTARLPGTATAGGTVTLPPAGGPWRETDAVHGPAPPPASVSATVRVALPPTVRRPNERSVGAAKINGWFAAGTWISPPPVRVVGCSL